MPADAACGVSFENHLCKRVVFFGWNTHLPRPHASCGSVFVSVKIFSVPVYQRVLRKRGRSDLGCVSPAFRSRFACKWNAELTISKRVIGIFRPRFACLQNSVIQCKCVAVRKGRPAPARLEKSGGKPRFPTVWFGVAIKGHQPVQRRSHAKSVKKERKEYRPDLELRSICQRAPEISEPDGP